MRELHWHPNCGRVASTISRVKSRMTVFASGGAAQTFDYQAGDVGYIPRAMPHYIENTGTTTMRFLEMFKSPKFEDVPLCTVAGVYAPRTCAGAPENRRVGPRENPAAQNARGRSLSQTVYNFRQSQCPPFTANPFLAQDIPGGKKGAGILRIKPNIKWEKDRGKEPVRDKKDFP